jgi:HlyD family secretion protein
MLKWFTIAAAVLGVGVALWAVMASTVAPPVLDAEDSPPSNPFPHGVAATGAVEASSRNIRVAATEPGLVTKVFVRVNDQVKEGDPLFQLDPRASEAELAKAAASVQVARRELERMRALPRPAELARLKASLDQAKARTEHATKEKERTERIRSRGAASEQEFDQSSLAVLEATAARAQAQADFDQARAGAWKNDLLVAEANLLEAEAQQHVIRSRLDRLTVRSPVNGTVLKRYLEPGEVAPPGSQPAIVVGDLSVLHVRAHVDERDAHRLAPQGRAVCFIRGQTGLLQDLVLVSVEPLAVPKNQLSASTSEVVDVRVIEVVFRIETARKSALLLYPGQVVDVFIDGLPVQ